MKTSDDAKQALDDFGCGCPFCRSTKRQLVQLNQNAMEDRWVVHCLACRAKGPEANTAWGAVEKWNVSRAVALTGGA